MLIPSLRKYRSLLGDGALLMASALLVNLGNYAFNLLAGRLVTPAVFGEISLLVTLLLALSFVAMAFQLTASRYPHTRGRLVRVAWQSGAALAVVTVALSEPIRHFFQLAAVWPIVLLALSIPVYFAMSVARGTLQGQLNYRRLAATYQIEVWVRLGLGLSLIYAGWGGLGVSIGLLASLLACYGLSRPALSQPAGAPAEETGLVWSFFGTTLCYELSQVLINNSDVMLVKHYLPDHDAGLYTALSMIGRVVYFATWSVVMVLFPKVVEQQQQGLPTGHLFWGSLGIVGAISGVIVAGCALLPDLIVRILFGPPYLAVAPYLWQYALATSLFALANVFVYYHLSLDRRRPVWLSGMAGLLQIGLIMVWHGSFQAIIADQLVAMLVFLLVLVVYHATTGAAPSATAENADSTSQQYRPSAT
ncbi:oligosaccharide flippase family protein [Spirosoma luteolum]